MLVYATSFELYHQYNSSCSVFDEYFWFFNSYLFYSSLLYIMFIYPPNIDNLSDQLLQHFSTASATDFTYVINCIFYSQPHLVEVILRYWLIACYNGFVENFRGKQTSHTKISSCKRKRSTLILRRVLSFTSLCL